MPEGVPGVWAILLHVMGAWSTCACSKSTGIKEASLSQNLWFGAACKNRETAEAGCALLVRPFP